MFHAGRPHFRWKLALGWLAPWTLVLWTGCSEGRTEEIEGDPLTRLGVTESTGAAAGYLPDLTCRTCHSQKYDSYQHVGMAVSFGRPGAVPRLEDFESDFYHQASQRYYRIRPEGERGLVFTRWQLDEAGEPINRFEVPIDWILGSGNRTRSYLYQTEWGELYQLPIGWYSEAQTWGMSPGFEGEDHSGVTRRVQRECMFCHNAFPQVPIGADQAWEPHRFPAELPSGTGCQRCHGPGAEHVRSALRGAELATTQAAIVNPAKLAPELRDSVCFQCHMLPSVSLIGIRRFDRSDYSYRPGQPLSDYLVHVDIDEKDRTREERFEINHHGYRFWQSPCYQQSGGQLACFDCHDPHTKPESAAFRNQVSTVCRGCHQATETEHAEVDRSGGDTCADCHMPTRRTQDVVLVTMTDHRIATGPFDREALLAPLEKRVPEITEVEVLPLGEPPSDREAELYRTVVALKSYASLEAVSALSMHLSHPEVEDTVPLLSLAEGQLKAQDFLAATRTAARLLELRPGLARGHNAMGVALTGLGRSGEAIRSLRASIALKPTPGAHYNLALAAIRDQKADLALEHLEAAIALRPNMHLAWWYQGRVHEFLGHLELARQAYERTLEIEPRHTPGYQRLIPLLESLGEEPAAQRYRTVGRAVAREPSSLEGL